MHTIIIESSSNTKIYTIPSTSERLLNTPLVSKATIKAWIRSKKKLDSLRKTIQKLEGE